MRADASATFAPHVVLTSRCTIKMSRPYLIDTLRKLADEADQFSVSHERNGERRTADLLYRVAKALRHCAAQGIETRRATTGTGVVHESPVGSADAPKPIPERDHD